MATTARCFGQQKRPWQVRGRAKAGEGSSAAASQRTATHAKLRSKSGSGTNICFAEAIPPALPAECIRPRRPIRLYLGEELLSLAAQEGVRGIARHNRALDFARQHFQMTGKLLKQLVLSFVGLESARTRLCPFGGFEGALPCCSSRHTTQHPERRS